MTLAKLGFRYIIHYFVSTDYSNGSIHFVISELMDG